MRPIRQMQRWLRALLFPGTVDRDMDAELRAHMEFEIDAGLARGLSRADAERAAVHTFGAVQRMREDARDAKRVGPARDLVGDVRYGWRILRRAPLFAVVAIVTLAIGIGANSALFSVVYGVLFRPLPFPNAEQLVSVWDGTHSRAEFSGIRTGQRSFTSVAAYYPSVEATLTSGGEPTSVAATLVSGDFFATLGVTPHRGRFFTVSEENAGAQPVVVISHALWRDRFGGDSGVIGRLIELDGVSRSVVGVAPAGFAFPDHTTRLWVPIEMRPDLPAHWGIYGHRIIGRLRDGVTAELARTDVLRLAREIREANPVWKPAMPGYLEGIVVRDLKASYVDTSRQLLLTLLGAVGLVLLITCANVANLLMVRGSARAEEFAVRRALGARQGRLTRQLVVESLLIAVLGGALGLVVAQVGIQGAIAFLPSTLPRLDAIRLDWATMGFTFSLTMLAATMFGIGPARSLAQPDRATLTGARAGATTSQRRFTRLLVVTQIAVGVVLVVAASLLVKSLNRLMRVQTGFDSESVVAARLSPPRARYADPNQLRQLGSSLVEQLRASRGVEHVAIATQLPFDQGNDAIAMWVGGWTTDPNRLELFQVRRVSPEFFDALSIPLRSGRLFSGADNSSAQAVAIVNETAARKYWADRSALGGQLRYPWPGELSVVGVVGDVRSNDLREPPVPTLYVPFEQSPRLPFSIVMRSASPTEGALALIRSVTATVAKDVPVSRETSLASLVEQSAQGSRSLTSAILAFSALAIVLGCIGTYGLIAYGVEARRREFAVRMALGASSREVVRHVMTEGLRLAFFGSAFGVVVAIAVGRAMRSMLFAVGPTDLASLALAPALLLGTAAIASFVPALRATRVQASSALRGG